MWKPLRRIKNMVFNNNDEIDYEPSYFLKDDEVKTPEGYEGTVISVRGKQVDVYLHERTMLELYHESELTLLSGVGFTYSGLQDEQSSFGNVHKDWTKKAYKPHHCTHWMDEFKLNEDSSVYLSAVGTTQNDRNAFTPDYGCYMDNQWQPKNSIWLTPNAPIDTDLFATCEIQSVIPSMYIKWPDMGVIPIKDYSEVIVWCMTRVMEIDAKLEIGCYGGHGRTGTVLAGLLVYNGMDGHDAIKEVRTRYCDRAIESKSQEDLIVEYSKQLKEITNG
jgi:hypothetical protein